MSDDPELCRNCDQPLVTTTASANWLHAGSDLFGCDNHHNFMTGDDSIAKVDQTGAEPCSDVVERTIDDLDVIITELSGQ